jgi:uncharacterized caspase-like protein
LRIRAFTTATLAGAILTLMAASAEAASSRIALVIGEAAYPDGALPTTANDAGLVAQVLQTAGFDVVGARDLDGKGIREAMRDFLDKANAAGPDMQAFVYVSGRALQYAGDNYIVPIDARIARAADAPIEAVKISDFTHALAAAPGLARVVVIDGARANPYAQQGDPLAGGLALVDPEPNTVIAFNAAPGAVGVQDAGDYGVYAKSLSGLMRQGGVDIRQVFEQVRLEVNQQTQGAQIPWSAGKFTAPYFIFERAADAAPPRKMPTRKPLKELSVEEAYEAVIARDDLKDYEEFLREHRQSEQARRVEAILAARREALFWRRALTRNKPEAYWTYLKLYPRGPHAYDAALRLQALDARREPPPDFEVIDYDDLPPPPRDELVYADRPYYYFGGDDFGPPPPPPPRDYYVEQDDDWRDLPPPPPQYGPGLLPALAIAIPLAIAARAYNDRPRPNGVAPASAPPPAPPRPFGPPPLPRGVQPVAAATPAPAAPAPAAPRGPGAVRFAAPPAAPAARTPPAPAGAPPAPARPPLPTPGAAPAATPAPALRPSTATPSVPTTPAPARPPLPTPGAAPAPVSPPKPAERPAQRNPDAPLAAPRPAPADAPRPAPLAAPRPAPAEAPRPAPAEAPRPAPPPRAEAPRPAPHVEAPRPAPAEAPRPAPHVEAPRPAPAAPNPPPAPHVEQPRPAPAAPPRPEPHAEAPRPGPGKPACGQPGQPRC